MGTAPKPFYRLRCHGAQVAPSRLRHSGGCLRVPSPRVDSLLRRHDEAGWPGLSVTDGPFTEAKEVVGGYALVEVKSKEEALQVARQFMELHLVHWPAFEGECEVRPLEDM